MCDPGPEKRTLVDYWGHFVVVNISVKRQVLFHVKS